MIEAAAEAFFSIHPHDDLKKQVEELVQAARHFAPRRNEIAHGVVTSMRRPYHGYALLPSEYATNKNKLPPAPLGRDFRLIPAYVYTRFELATFTARFRELWRRADDANDAVRDFHRSQYPPTPKP